MGEQRVAATYNGSELSFIYDKSSQVPFRVYAGGVRKLVYLPLDMSAPNPVLYGSDAFAAGCDLQEKTLSHHFPIALLLISLLTTRRKLFS